MSKIHILIGYSACGKSTYARELLEKEPNTVIIGRDKIRELLFGYTESSVSGYYLRHDLKEKEHTVTRYQNILIDRALRKRQNVILDNTHLKERYIEAVGKQFYHTPITFHNVPAITGIGLGQALENDSKRHRKVGERIIRDQYAQYQQLVKHFCFTDRVPVIEPIVQNVNLPHCAIFDIDGTLAERTDRSPFEWGRVGEDKLNTHVYHIYKAMSSQMDVIICTGRDGSCSGLTKDWLMEHGINWSEFHIRPTGNFEKDYVIKERMWRDIAERYYIIALFDDRHQVIAHGKLLGLDMVNVKGVEQDF